MSKPHFRAGVVTVVQRDDGDVLVFERVDTPGAWQLPQGGIEDGESPVEAAWRELEEETGLTSEQVRLVAEPENWTAYEWPRRIRKSGRMGQVHRWFIFELVDSATVPAPDGHEFSDWKWMRPSELIDHVVDFRKAPYRQVFGG